MPTIAHYEVYTLEDSGWVLHARFASADKVQALDEARSLDNFLGRAVKVVRESYDSVTDSFSNQTVFLSPKAEAIRRQNREQAQHAAAGIHPGVQTIESGLRPNARMPGGLDAFAPGKEQTQRPRVTRFGAPTHATSTSDLIARVMFVIIGALVMATSGTALIPIVVSLMHTFGISLEGDALAQTLFAVFMVLFLASGFLLTLRLVPLQGVLGDDRPRARSRSGRRTKKPHGLTAEPKTGGADASAEGSAADSAAQGGAGAVKAADRNPQKQAQAEAEVARIEETQLKNDNEHERNLEDEREKERKKDENQLRRKKKKRDSGANEDDAKIDGDGTDNEEGTPDPEQEEVLSFAFQSARDIVAAFLGTYVSALRSIRPRLDTYNRFGINLYLAGVCDIIAQTGGLTFGEFERLLRETVEIMGTRTPQAASFVERLKNYLEENRYSQMVQCGREAMILQRTGGAEPFANLGMVIEDWNTPKTQKVTGNTIAILFTDIVGSTDMTSEYGDIKAQQILRAHNAAVRAALARFSGREIKHTGDGIMATYEHVPDSVWGMIDVLKAVRAHNQLQPEIPLRIRIGINAGEPVSAENDYYGLAVTLAARICAQADMNQILVSQIVRDLCEGTDLKFADHGAAELKGIKQAQPLHEALWDGSPTVLAQQNGETGKVSEAREDGKDGAADQATDAEPPEQNPAAVFDPDAEGWLSPPASPPSANPPREVVESNLPDIPEPPLRRARDH